MSRTSKGHSRGRHLRSVAGVVAALAAVAGALSAPAAARPPSAASAPARSGFHEGACYYSIWSDGRDAAELDAEVYSAAYDCSRARWAFSVFTSDDWDDSRLSSFAVSVDSDGDGTTGCGGFDRVVVATFAGGALTAETRATPSCTSSARAGPATVERPDRGSIRLLVAHADLGSPPRVRWKAEIRGTGSGGDLMPDTGEHLEQGFAGGACDAEFTAAGHRSYTVVDRVALRAATHALRAAGMGAVRSLAGGVVSFLGDPVAAQEALTTAGIRAPVTRDGLRAYAEVPDDPEYPLQWALPAVDAPLAWDRAHGSPAVVVAVIDSGVDSDHPDLAGKLVAGFDMTTSAPLAPGNTDAVGHGTGVAGVVAAVTGNGFGLASLGWDTKVMMVKDGDNAPLRSNTVAGIRYATERRAAIINVSSGSECSDPIEAQAVQEAQAKGSLVVASAGNAAHRGNRIVYPAALPGVLAVGATAFDGARAYYSNFGDYVSLVAPGGSNDGVAAHDVRVLAPGGGTTWTAGTSFSAPMVSATAALLLGARPELTAADLSRLVTSTATDLPPAGRDMLSGAGRLNAAAALAAAGVPVRTTTPPVPPPPPPPPPPPSGYRLVASDGGIFALGDAAFLGSTGDLRLNRPIVGAASTPSGNGYWLVASDGGIFAFGDARFLGSTGDLRLNRPIVGAASTPSGNGYWLVASDGGIFAFGDARFLGSTGNLALNRPIVGMAPTPSGAGYWLVASDGGIFAFGDAAFLGSTGNVALNRPIVGMAPTPSGAGYWLVASDGGIFAFGDARFLGSTGNLALNRPIVGMAPTPSGAGYWLVASDGGIFAFGDARFLGSTGNLALNRPIVGMARAL